MTAYIILFEARFVSAFIIQAQTKRIIISFTDNCNSSVAVIKYRRDIFILKTMIGNDTPLKCSFIVNKTDIEFCCIIIDRVPDGI